MNFESNFLFKNKEYNGKDLTIYLKQFVKKPKC